MILIAHRGFRSKIGENCMEDFTSALKTCKAVEFDIRMTKDKQIIIFHDHNFKRIGGVNKRVRNFTYDEILGLKFFQDHPRWIPPLFLADFTKKIAKEYEVINVEIKADRYTAEEYEALGAALDELSKTTKAEIIVSSFSKNTLQWIKTLDSRFKKGYLFEKPGEIDFDLLKGFDYINPYIGMITKKSNIKTIEKINLPMNIWTLKSDADISRITKIYPKNIINSLISDVPLEV